MNATETATILRKRISEYREAHKEVKMSVHFNAIEISLCLFEYAIEKKRSIEKQEEGWFNAGFMIDQLLKNSKWEDIADMYYVIAEEVERRNFFR
jgi:hypothetical protein